jgi:tRNA(Met) cytidine acetyltransferase
MQHIAFSPWLNCYQQQALMFNERRLVVLIGNNTWASSLLKSFGDFHSNEQKCKENFWLIYGDNSNFTSNVTKQRFRDKLGTESDFVIFQDTELSIDAFACLSGTLVAGGIFFLLIDELSQITESLFYKRFFNVLRTFSEHVVIEQDNFVLPTIDKSNPPVNLINKIDKSFAYNCVTQEQVTAVESVINVCKGKRNKPLVLTADRGRGKSSALAIACAELLKAATKEYELRLVITAADAGSLAVFFNRLLQSFPAGELNKGKFTSLHGSVEFIAVDELIKNPVKASLILVDEAAGIPIYLLEKLLSISARLVFATTIHGYEGAGRGFTLKFQHTLAVKFPKWQSLHIKEPIRWRANDPLERLVFETCLLNAELPNINVGKHNSSLIFKHYNATELINNEQLFKQMFSVLVTAHYQTKPSDVRMILDNKQVQVVCLLSQKPSTSQKNTAQQIVAVALLINEGKTGSNTIEDVKLVSESKRRLKNHFVPQSLLTQCGVDNAFDYSYMRVMRIAVHPQLHSQGIGRDFLDEIAKFASLQNVDFIASSFGATKPLLSFWLKNNFHLARIGFNKDKASGEQSALVLKALSEKSNVVLDDINANFYRSFDYLLTDEYKFLSAELVALILNYCSESYLIELSSRDIEHIRAFALGHRQYSSCVYSLHLWLMLMLARSTVNIDDDVFVFISRIFQKHSITEVCSTYGFTGKKALEQFLKAKIKFLLAI